ncbi:hypothetical protein [Natronorubrum texcoconense]|uniref:Uncharacterized protein n=1 Tax=Natronorubrum texcoconense TaxID=1095776 RepID=A0A1G9HBJ7_9EURY|nr:hypothetical protein [Natronorubrum texcoconense]SDL10381.1 hypothetical protein SAMN04515672_0190 [Natronorubrum texcoconense]
MSVTELNTQSDSVEISLADVGADVPPSVTCEVTLRAVGIGHQVLEIHRRGETFILEGAPFAELTGVAGRDELPERVPDWIEPVVELFGVGEVELGR